MVVTKGIEAAEKLDLFVAPHDARRTKKRYFRRISSDQVAPGKGSIVYTAHPYHTKMPIEVIVPHITHYTNAGDIVLDPFCGSGMTGVAALASGRRTVLVDLSPAACHIARGYVSPTSPERLERTALAILHNALTYESRWYGTRCRKCGAPARIAYTIWSADVKCVCGNSFILWNVAVDERGEFKRDPRCPTCHAPIRGRSYERLRYVPVITVYDCQGTCRDKRQEAPVDTHERSLTEMSEFTSLVWWSPPDAMMKVEPGTKWGEQWRAGYHRDITHVKDFYTLRAWASLALLYDEIGRTDSILKRHLLFAFTACLPAVSRMVKYLPTRGGRSNTPGTLYLPGLSLEQNVFRVFERRLRRIASLVRWQHQHDFRADDACVVISSATDLRGIPNNMVDYIFTDPPFAENIQYAELNFLMEAWLKEYTDSSLEGVISPARGLGPDHFAAIMSQSFKEMVRVLKPGHYCSVVFHNTNARNWQLLMTAIRGTGFRLRSIDFIDKGQAGWNQVTSEYAASFDPILQLEKSAGHDALKEQGRPVRRAALTATIETHLKSNPEPRQRTTAYLHSLVVRQLVMAGNEKLIPTPRQLASQLQRDFMKRGRLWFSRDERVPPSTLEDFYPS